MRTLGDLKAQLRKDPEFVKEYEALEPEYQVARAVLTLRLQRGLSQTELAKRAGTKQASVSRVERAETVPTLTLLKKLAAALDSRLEIRFVPLEEDVKDARIIERMLAQGGEFVSLEEALADYKATTGVEVTLEELKCESEQS